MQVVLNYLGHLFSGLRFRLLLLVMIACAPLVVLTLHTAWNDRHRALTVWRQRAAAVQESSAREEETVFNKTRTLLLTMAQLGAIRSGNTKESKVLVDELARTYPRYSDLGVIDTNANIIASSAPARARLDQPGKIFLRRAMQADDVVVSSPVDNTGGKPLIHIVYPVTDPDGSARGAVYASLNMSWFSRPGAEYVAQLPRDAVWSEVAPDGSILVRFPGGKNWVGKHFLNEGLLEAVRARKEGLIEMNNAQGVPSYFAFAPKQTHLLPENTFTILSIPQSVLFADADRSLVHSLGWLIVAAGIPLLFIWIGSDLLIVRPVRELVRSSARLASGDLSARTGLPPGRDELGRLTLAFDSMAQALEQRELERKRATHKLQILSHRLVEVQETERRHIARELHDEIGQSLTVAEMNLQAALQSSRQEALNRKLQASMEAVERVLDQVHDLSLNLRPSMLDDLGLEPALRWYTNRQAALTGLRTRFKSDPLESRLDAFIETECFRVAQEALTNVVRHSKATAVGVELRRNGEMLHLRVRDDGIGFDVASLRDKAVRGASLGLLSMQERATMSGGGLEFMSAPGEGTEVHAWFPLRYRDAA
ncbi:MAG TPA: ATP-binding protein [Verrucomicrobiae bacterium]|nr:ATP-binding protein [Verrucomicrobiae bacterium]